MTRKLFSKKRLVFAVSCIVMGVLVVGIYSPRTTIGYWFFRCAYASPIDKGYFLESYHSHIWNHGGGYIHEPTDKFLCSRLEISSSQTEIDAVTRFYALQASGREGQRIVALSDKAKQKVIGSIMKNLERYESHKVGKALLLVEELRRGEEIHKGHFSSTNTHESANWETWWRKKGMAKLKTCYRNWWNAETSWAVKQKQNPLVSSEIEATGL